MKPLIFIPGIEATNLVNSNSFGFETVWNAFDTLGTALKTKVLGQYHEERLQLNPLYDERIGSIIERESIAKLPYERAIRNLVEKLNEKKQFSAPVYLFGYDWRLSNVENGKRLKNFVEYLKIKLKDKGVESFCFLTHSMGALVLGCYFKLLSDFKDIDKVVFCAPPFLGSLYALVHMVKGDAGFKSFLNKIFGRNDDIRKVVRTYPSIYELLPSYDGALKYSDNQESLNLLNRDHWQSNVYDDIDILFEQRLKDLKGFRWKGMMDLAGLPAEVRQKMVILAGVDDDMDTLTYLNVLRKDGKILNRLILNDLKAGMGQGDGTVPQISSTLYKDSIRTITIEKDDLFSELSTNVDFHGLFLQDSRVQNIISRYFTTPSEAANMARSQLTPLKGRAANMWFSIGDTVHNLSPF